jgi:hypothetical protein
MIEFKAECGHTVRARDQDAGKAVQCSYCGKTANVPDDLGEKDGLEFLLSEVERAAEKEGGPAPKKKRRKGSWGARRRDFDPFGFSLKLIYIAALFIVVFVVSKKLILPWFNQEGALRRVVGTPSKPPEEPVIEAPSNDRVRRLGLRTLAEDARGLFVSSTPAGAMAYYVPAADAPSSGRIAADPRCNQLTGARPVGVPAGEYVIEVAMDWNDPAFSGYPGYWEFHETIEGGHDRECSKALAEAFIPDGESALFLDRTRGRMHIVRQYRNVLVYEGQCTSVRALFLPRLDKPDGTGFSLERLIDGGFLPSGRLYNFDTEHARKGLAHYGVPEDEQQFILAVLERIGVAPCATRDKGMRLFSIGINTGSFSAPLIPDKRP